MMLGMLLGILTYRPIFSTFLKDTNVKQSQSGQTASVMEESDRKIIGTDTIVRINARFTANNGISYSNVVTDTLNSIPKTAEQIIKANVNAIDLNKHLPPSLYWKFVGLVFLLILYVTMVYGPIAAFLVEMFPTKIRYTSMSLPYHIGNGVFGGLVPFIGLLLTTSYPKDPLVGLWYPIGVAALCLIIGTIYLNNKIDKEVND